MVANLYLVYVLFLGWNSVHALCSIDKTAYVKTGENLTYIDPLDFRDCYGASTVNVSFNKISSLSNDTFSLLWNIQVLDLSNNEILELPSHVFVSLRSVRYLNLSHNLLETLPLEFFNNKQNLISVDISHNSIIDIPLPVFRFQMASIQLVDLSYNRLAAFEPWAYYGQAIRLLDLRYNNISTYTNHYNWTIDHRLVYDSVGIS